MQVASEVRKILEHEPWSSGSLDYDEVARILTYARPGSASRKRPPLPGKLAILSAGTADTAVAQVQHNTQHAAKTDET